MSEPSTTDRTDATVQRILDGAFAAAELHGLRKLTMDEIAKYTGLARVTLYKYFPNKHALVGALTTREINELFVQIAAISSQHTDIDTRLTEMFTHGYLQLRNNGLLQRLLATEPETIFPIIAYDSPFLTFGRRLLEHQLADDLGPSDRSAEWISRVSEHVVRVMQSLLLAPPSVFDLGNPDEVRQLVRSWILPTLHAEE